MVVRAIRRCFATAAVLLAVVLGPVLAANAADLQVTPGGIGVGAFFRAAGITLEGRAPAGSEPPSFFMAVSPAGGAGRAVVTGDAPLDAPQGAPYVQTLPATDGHKGLYQQRQITGDRVAAGSFAYRLRLSQDGRAVAAGRSVMPVRTVGLLASLAYLARHRGTVYGCMAALTAVLVGLAANTLFCGLERLVRRRRVSVPKEDGSRAKA